MKPGCSSRPLMAFPGMAWARRITEFDPTRLFITNVRPVEIGRLQTGSFQAQSGVGACVDGPLGARGLLHDLTSGATAVMCPAFDAAR